MDKRFVKEDQQTRRVNDDNGNRNDDDDGNDNSGKTTSREKPVATSILRSSHKSRHLTSRTSRLK